MNNQDRERIAEMRMYYLDSDHIFDKDRFKQVTEDVMWLIGKLEEAWYVIGTSRRYILDVIKDVKEAKEDK